jgi:anti-sigma factor RsiW
MKANRKPSNDADRSHSLECEEFAWLLTEYWEGEGDQDLGTEIETHSRECPYCAEILRTYVQTIRVCRSSPRACASRDAHQRFWEQLVREIQALKDYLE